MGIEQAPSPYRAGVRAVLPLCVAVAGFGISYGVLARAAGFPPAAAVVMSATTFAGSAQFASASILESGGTVAAAILAAVLLNLRYAPIGVSVAPVMTGGVVRRLVVAQRVVDESWAIANRGDGTFDRGRLIGAGLALYVAWVGSTVVGALGAEALGDPAALGLDAAFPALFLALLWPQVQERRPLAAAILGGAIALALVPVSPPGVPIIAAAAGCLLGLIPSREERRP
ncbi:MAG TPA: AzlC family ABC transporter permease [Actinomycetota bacterium]|nr:AzlC family ABC transporter permease [Actinomycetota bacterium]